MAVASQRKRIIAAGKRMLFALSSNRAASPRRAKEEGRERDGGRRMRGRRGGEGARENGAKESGNGREGTRAERRMEKMRRQRKLALAASRRAGIGRAVAADAPLFFHLLRLLFELRVSRRVIAGSCSRYSRVRDRAL